MKHTISVTEEDIKKGEPGNCSRCAISQALIRKFKIDEVSTEVDGGDVILSVKEKKYQVNHMHESDVLDFIFDFDQEDGWSEVKPIKFEIIENEGSNG